MAIRPLYAEASKRETCYIKRPVRTGEGPNITERTVLAMLFVFFAFLVLAVAGLVGLTADSRDTRRWYPAEDAKLRPRT
jgi:hypothetical protein